MAPEHTEKSLYRQVFDASPRATAVYDPVAEEIVEANDAATDLLGDDREGLLGLALADVPSLASAQRPDSGPPLVEEGRLASLPVERPDGSVRRVDATVEETTVDDQRRLLLFFEDSTDEDERRTDEHKLRQLTESTNDVLWIFSGDWTETLFVNSAYEDLWGRSVETLREEPTDFLRGVHPDDHDMVTAGMERLSAGDPQDLEFRVNPEEDFERWVWVQATPITDDSGTVQRVVGFSRDVTERKRRQHQLADTRKRLETLYQTAPDAIVAADAETGEIVETNPAAEDLFNRPQSEMIGSNVTMLHPPEQTERYRELFAEAVEVGNPDTFTQFNDGSWIYVSRPGDEHLPVEINARMVMLDDRKVIYGIFRDISDRKAMQEKFETVNEMTVELTAAETTSEVCERAIETVEKGLKQPFSVVWQTTDTGLEATAWTAAIDDFVEDSEDLVHPHGDPVWDLFDAGEVRVVDDLESGVLATDIAIESLLAVPLDDHGLLTIGARDTGAFNTVDIHLAALLGQHLTTVLDRLEYEQALEEYQQDLERSNENLQQFAYIASHDLQEPLRMVSSYVDLLAAEFGDDIDEEAQEYIDFAIDGAERMRNMIDALLAYARVETQGESFEPVDVESVLEGTVQSLELLIADHDATVTYDDLPTVVADSHQLGQVFQNLVKNAIQHAGDAPIIEVSATERDDDYRFTVTDDGDGISERQQKQIFEIFHSEDGDGTGIGLSVCQRIVNRHGGDIGVESTENEGATFWFTIPKRPAAREEDSSE